MEDSGAHFIHYVLCASIFRLMTGHFSLVDLGYAKAFLTIVCESYTHTNDLQTKLLGYYILRNVRQL